MKLSDLLKEFGDIELNKENESKIYNLLLSNEMPNFGDYYYGITEYGAVDDFMWDGCNVDKYRFRTNNVFKTKEEAEFRLEQIKAYNELVNFAKTYNTDKIDWNDRESSKYSIFFNCTVNNFGITKVKDLRDIGAIYFTSEELAKQAIEKIGEERLGKYLFGDYNDK